MKQLISLLLSTALVLLSCTSSFGVSFQGEKEAREIAEIKRSVEKFGIRTTRVAIRLRNKKKLEGYVQQIADDHLVVSDLKTNTETRVAYSEILQVREIKERRLGAANVYRSFAPGKCARFQLAKKKIGKAQIFFAPTESHKP